MILTCYQMEIHVDSHSGFAGIVKGKMSENTKTTGRGEGESVTQFMLLT